MPPVFDTLTYARDMERAGFTREQAEGLASGQAKLIDDRLATKDDIETQRMSLVGVIEDVRTTLSRETSDLRKELHQAVKDLSTEIKTSQRETINRFGILLITVIGAATAVLGLVSRLPR